MDPVTEHFRWIGLKGLSENTRRSRWSVLRTLGRSLPVPLLEATPDMLLAWRFSLEGRRPATIAGYLSHVRQFYGWAVERSLIPADPTVDIPRPKCPQRLPRPIPYDDLVAALNAATPRIRVWLVLAGWCGFRACEIARLRAENITLAGPRPSILVAADATKGSRERIVPASPFVVAELRGAGLPVKGWAFRRLDDRPGPPAAWSVSQQCCAHLHDCGFPATLHQLRHWFLTEYYEASGFDIRATQEVAGHSRVDTTAGYAAVRPGRGAATVLRIPVPAHLRAAPAPGRGRAAQQAAGHSRASFPVPEQEDGTMII